MRALLDLVYPPLCMHCQCLKSKEDGVFCNECNQSLEMLDPSRRCIHCFSTELRPIDTTCKDCKREAYFKRVAAVFDYFGPPSTLIKKMKYGAKPYLADGIAAFMATQFFHLEWPTPDFITAPPMSWLKEIDRGYNQSNLIGEALSKYLRCPFRKVLSRSMAGYSQAGLDLDQRLEMNVNPFRLKADISKKNILLIDDVFTTGTTLKKCAKALQIGSPASIYVLTFCRA